MQLVLTVVPFVILYCSVLAFQPPPPPPSLIRHEEERQSEWRLTGFPLLLYRHAMLSNPAGFYKALRLLLAVGWFVVHKLVVDWFLVDKINGRLLSQGPLKVQ